MSAKYSHAKKPWSWIPFLALLLAWNGMEKLQLAIAVEKDFSTSLSSCPPTFSVVILPTHFSNKIFRSLCLQCHKIHPSLKACSLDSLFKCREWQCSHIPNSFPWSTGCSSEDREGGNFWDVFSNVLRQPLLCRTLALTLLTSWLAHRCHCGRASVCSCATICACVPMCAILPLFLPV